MSRSPSILIFVGSRTFPMLLVYLLEEEVRVGQSGAIGINIVARFLHAMPYNASIVKATQLPSCEYLVSLESGRRHALKRLMSNNHSYNDGRRIRNNRRDIAKMITLRNYIVPRKIRTTASENISSSQVAYSPASESNREGPTATIETNNKISFLSGRTNSSLENKNVEETSEWLHKYIPVHESKIFNYTNTHPQNLSHEELTSFCKPLDNNQMRSEITEISSVPKLVIYCAVENDVELIWKIVCLFDQTTEALTAKLSSVFNLPKERLHSVWLQGPRGIRVLMCNDLVSNMEKESVYLVQLVKDSPVGYFKLLLKPYDG